MRVPHKKHLVASRPPIERTGGVFGTILVVILAAGLFASLLVASFLNQPTGNQPADAGSSGLVDRSTGNANSEPSSKTGPFKYSVTIRKPAGPPRVLTGQVDAAGKEITIACSTCHATRHPNFENKTVANLDEFHRTLKLAHGTVSCLSCHNSEDYDALKLADGTKVEFTDVMTLCAQCHGPQMTDFEHGAHGGMNGHWDLNRGPQTKNNCVDCHQPHAPQFPKMKPTFKPRDRFLEQEGH